MNAELTAIVEKCVEHMFNDPYFTGKDREYDIVQAHLEDGDWTVVLMPTYAPERMYMYTKWAKREKVTCATYVRAYSSQAKF